MGFYGVAECCLHCLSTDNFDMAVSGVGVFSMSFFPAETWIRVMSTSALGIDYSVLEMSLSDSKPFFFTLSLYRETNGYYCFL